MLTTGPALYRLLLLVKKSRRQGSRTVTRFLINDFAFFVRSVQIEISASTFPIVRYFVILLLKLGLMRAAASVAFAIRNCHPAFKCELALEKQLALSLSHAHGCMAVSRPAYQAGPGCSGL